MEANTVAKLLALIERETGVVAQETTTIDALDIDSLEFICLIQAIRAEVAPISTKRATDAQTVRDLLEALEV